MKINNKISFALLFVMLGAINQSSASSAVDLMSPKVKTIVKIGLGIVSLYATYKLYNYFKPVIDKTINEAIEDRIVRSIELILKSNNKCSDDELRQKAKLINLRKVVIHKLEEGSLKSGKRKQKNSRFRRTSFSWSKQARLSVSRFSI